MVMKWPTDWTRAIGTVANAASVGAVVAGFAIGISTLHYAAPRLETAPIDRDGFATDLCTDNPADPTCPPVGPADARCTSAAWKYTARCAGGPFAPNLFMTPLQQPPCSPAVAGCPGWAPPAVTPTPDAPPTGHEPPPHKPPPHEPPGGPPPHEPPPGGPPPGGPPPVVDHPEPGGPAASPPAVSHSEPGAPAAPQAVVAPPAPVAPPVAMAPAPVQAPVAPVAPAPVMAPPVEAPAPAPVTSK
jgi:hypothetical protein